jgi:hypothetical protein
VVSLVLLFPVSSSPAKNLCSSTCLQIKKSHLINPFRKQIFPNPAPVEREGVTTVLLYISFRWRT